jgi:hypothetical protein
LLVLFLRSIHSHYAHVSEALGTSNLTPNDLHGIADVAIVPIADIHRGTLRALTYAKRISTNVRAVCIITSLEQRERIEQRWARFPELTAGVQLVCIDYDYRDVLEPLVEYISHANNVEFANQWYHSTKWWRIKDEFSGVCQGVLGVQKAAVGSERITIREQTSNDRSARWPWPAFVVANGGDGVGQSWVGAGNDGKYRSYKWSPRETWLYAKSPDVWPHGDCAESGSPGVRERLR